MKTGNLHGTRQIRTERRNFQARKAADEPPPSFVSVGPLGKISLVHFFLRSVHPRDLPHIAILMHGFTILIRNRRRVEAHRFPTDAAAYTQMGLVAHGSIVSIF
jgi:hypothetical protein